MTCLKTYMFVPSLLSPFGGYARWTGWLAIMQWLTCTFWSCDIVVYLRTGVVQDGALYMHPRRSAAAPATPSLESHKPRNKAPELKV